MKIGGGMRGMSGDKGGAAAVCGLFAHLARTRPSGVRVVGMLAVVINDIGPSMYRPVTKSNGVWKRIIIPG